MRVSLAFIGLLLLTATFRLCFAQEAEWVKFESKAGSFSVLMPAQPTEEKKTTTTTDTLGKPVSYTSNLYIARGDGEIYGAGWVDYQAGYRFDPKKELELNRDNFVKGVKANLTGSKDITLGAYQGFEFTAQTDEMFFKSQVFIVGLRPYMLIHVFKTENAPTSKKFFSSFHVAPKVLFHHSGNHTL